MKPYAWLVKQGNLPYLCYSKEEAIRYHKHLGSKEPITELYERTTHCVKESFDAGYAKALEDVKVLSDAVTYSQGLERGHNQLINNQGSTMKDYLLALAIGLSLAIGALQYFDVLVK